MGQLVQVGGRVPAAGRLAEPGQQDGIASTALMLTGSTSVPTRTSGRSSCWWFGNRVAFWVGTEMRVYAGLHMLENCDPRPVQSRTRTPSDLVLVTREEITEHAAGECRVLEAERRTRLATSRSG